MTPVFAPAPLHNALAEGPEAAEAVWLTTSDGKRLRAGLWNAQGTAGTVVLLPGRSEYVEKYGRTAAQLARAGYATLTLDWRGQGLSARALADPLVGHVGDFAEYQSDLDTLLAFATARALPEPWHLLAHSMGGTIGLRALMRGLPFRRAAFTAPMWEILIAPWLRPVAQGLAALSRPLGFDHLYVPSTGPAIYTLTTDFAGNTLTRDRQMWDYMRAQNQALPELALGGPSLGWLRAALSECRALARLPSPACPALCALGGQERIVAPQAIHRRMSAWPQGQLRLYPEAEHEVLMETPPTRMSFLQDCLALFAT